MNSKIVLILGFKINKKTKKSVEFISFRDVPSATNLKTIRTWFWVIYLDFKHSSKIGSTSKNTSKNAWCQKSKLKVTKLWSDTKIHLACPKIGNAPIPSATKVISLINPGIKELSDQIKACDIYWHYTNRQLYFKDQNN